MSKLTLRFFSVRFPRNFNENFHLAGAETAASQQEVDRHLELGKQFLVAGQLSDALTHYHAAVGECRFIHTLVGMWPAFSFATDLVFLSL